MQIYFDSALLVLLLGVSAFFAASEVAFLSISNVRLHSLVEKRAPNSECLHRLRSNKRRIVVALLIGSNLANVGASALATSISISIFGEEGLGIAVGVMSFLLLTFGDIAPKSFATTYGEKLALSFAPIIEGFYYLSYPLVVLFEAINRLIPGVYSRATGIEQFTEDEVRSAVKLGAKHKGISEDERRLIENVLAFNDRTVGEAMTPGNRVVSLQAGLSITDAYRQAVASEYSRFPVIKNGKVAGTVGLKVLAKAAHGSPNLALEHIAWPPVKFHRSMAANAAFAHMQKVGRNIAVVVNEKDELVGLVTIEDLLEELVGEIK